MYIESEKDFTRLRETIKEWQRRFPMFRHDVNAIEHAIEIHIRNYSNALVQYRQSHKKNYLEKAQAEIEAINAVVAMAEKMQLMAILSQR